MPNDESIEDLSHQSPPAQGLPLQSPDFIEQDFPDQIDNIVFDLPTEVCQQSGNRPTEFPGAQSIQ